MTNDERDQNVAMIRASAAAITGGRGALKRIRELRFREPGFDRVVWSEICSLGWLGLRLDEAQGGAGLGMVETCALMEELGAALVPEPIIPAMAAMPLLPADLRQRALEGSEIVLLAWQEALDAVHARPTAVWRGGKVSGTKIFVPCASGADGFAITVDGGIALVRRDSPGLDIVSAGHVDGGFSATLRLDGVEAEFMPTDLVQYAIDMSALATAAYLLGLAQAAHEATLSYLGTRRQFGRLIGSFQSLQHRAVDQAVQLALCRASVRQAAELWDAETPLATKRRAISRAKARASDTSLLVTRQAVQMHGGIGFTDEHDIGLYLRKAMSMANSYGSSRLHRARFGQLSAQTT